MQVMTVPGWLGVALPILLMGLLWLAEAAADKPAHALFGDRIVLLALLIPAAVLGWSTVAVTSLSLAVLAAMLWPTRTPKTQLTPD